MANADEFCQFARFGQTVKIQKCLQSHRVDVNALNLFGESALSAAVYYNQILCVEYLLANKANPKLRLSAGHTAIHIACRLGNVPILQMLLSLKTKDSNPEQNHRAEKHLFECLRIEDNSKLTPIHWAATQESVSKRQKMFAYLDRQMPGVLDSRYDPLWFDSWAKSHPWVIDVLPVPPTSSEISSLDISVQGSSNNYERTPRPPILPTTPKTSCKVTVTSIYHIPKQDPYIYRARRVQIGPTIDFPPPPSDLDGDYEDLNSPLSSKRPSHNLLSNIVPSNTEQYASSSGFEPEQQTQQEVDGSEESDSISSEETSEQIDYICQSTSTLNMASPRAHTYYI